MHEMAPSRAELPAAVPWTRRRFLKTAGGGLAGALVLGSGFRLATWPDVAAGGTTPAVLPPTRTSAPEARRVFRSRPDLQPQVITVSRASGGVAPGYVFFTPANGVPPDGPMIADDAGNPIWLRPDGEGYATNFRVSTYRGAPVLSWWEGQSVGGHGQGSYVIADGSYREVARVRAGNGYQGDLHEFILTPQGTALFTVFGNVPNYTGPWKGPLLEGIVQEVDVATGKVLFEWHSGAHVGVDESYAGPPTQPDQAFDYFHVNSIDVADDGNLVVSGRHTWTVYKIDRVSGEIVWRLGGKKTDFAMGPGAQFYWQHDARAHPGDVMTIFDDGASGGPNPPETQSRALTLQLDTASMSADVARALTHPNSLLATSQGNVEVMSDGGTFVGWGSAPYFSEYGPEGTLRYDAQFSNGPSYRAFRFPWVGTPAEPPAVAADATLDGRLTVYASWNGATEIATWEVLAGPSRGQLERGASVSKAGFETAIVLPTWSRYVAVRAVDAGGAVLGESAPLQVQLPGARLL